VGTLRSSIRSCRRGRRQRPRPRVPHNGLTFMEGFSLLRTPEIKAMPRFFLLGGPSKLPLPAPEASRARFHCGATYRKM
jgi:hypothetical protein